MILLIETLLYDFSLLKHCLEVAFSVKFFFLFIPWE